MQTYEFLVRLDIGDLDEISDDILCDALFEAGCDDALLFNDGGEVILEFSRESSSEEEAIKSALEDIRTAGYKPFYVIK